MTNCSPIGQFSTLGSLKGKSVHFFESGVKLSVDSAQINTINCREKQQLIAKDNYKEIQNLAASAETAFSVIEEKGKSRCLTYVASMKNMLYQKFKLEKDQCASKGFAKVTFENEKKAIYLSKDQIEFLNLRKTSKK